MPRTDCMDRRGSQKRGASRLAAVAVLVALEACRPSPDVETLPGAWWVAERAALETLLDQAESLETTPFGLRARALRAALPPDCPRLGHHAPNGALSDLAAGVRCIDDAEPLASEFLRARNAATSPLHLLLAWPDAAGSPVRSRVSLDAEGVAVQIEWTGIEATGIPPLLLPGEQDTGPSHLASTDRLLHLHVRPGEGLDLAALAPPESQADRLFRLRSGLFESAVLDGDWEFGLYEAKQPGQLPSVALVLGVRSKRVASAAAERFAKELATTWSVTQTPFRNGAARGSCLPELNVLPELAPCYVVTEDALVIGWNASSLERALGEGARGASSKAPAQLEVDLARIARSDARASKHLAESLGAPPLAIEFPWQRLSAQALRQDEGLRIDARLHLSGPS